MLASFVLFSFTPKLRRTWDESQISTHLARILALFDALTQFKFGSSSSLCNFQESSMCQQSGPSI